MSFGSNQYNRNISNEITRLNSRFIDDSNNKKYNHGVVQHYTLNGRGKSVRHREADYAMEMTPNIMKPAKGYNMSGGNWLDTLGKVASISQTALSTARKAVPAVKGIIDTGRDIQNAVQTARAVAGRGKISGLIMEKPQKPVIYKNVGKGAKRYNKKKHMESESDSDDMEGAGFFDFVKDAGKVINKVAPVAIEGFKLAKSVKGSGKMTPKQRGALVSAYMKAHKVSLGEASKAVSAYNKGQHAKLSGGAFKWLKHAFQKVGKVAETVGSDAYNLAKQGAQTALQVAPDVIKTVAQNPELLAMAV